MFLGSLLPVAVPIADLATPDNGGVAPNFANGMLHNTDGYFSPQTIQQLVVN